MLGKQLHSQSYNKKQQQSFAMPLVEIFKRDRKHWQHAQREQVQLFFLLNPFFNRYYEHQDFDKVVDLIFYTKIEPKHHLSLQINKKSDIIVLLQGSIQIFRKALAKQMRKKSHKNQKHDNLANYIKIGEYGTQMQTIQIKNDVIVRVLGEKHAEILFVPTMLFQQYVKTVINRRIQTISGVLAKVFGQSSEKYMRSIAQRSCKVRQFKMNSYIYRAGSIPQYCYITISGSVKIETPGFSARKMLEMAIVGENGIFGQKDLNQVIRLQNAICCSAHCKVLQIQKEPYNKFILAHQEIHPSYALKLKDFLNNRAQKSAQGYYSEKIVLPKLERFHSFVKPQEEEVIQKQIVQNCHILLQLSPKRKRSASSFRFPEHAQKDYSINPFRQKIRLFNKRKRSVKPLDLENKLF